MLLNLGMYYLRGVVSVCTVHLILHLQVIPVGFSHSIGKNLHSLSHLSDLAVHGDTYNDNEQTNRIVKITDFGNPIRI